VGFEPLRAVMVKEREENMESSSRYYGGLREKELLYINGKSIILYFNLNS